MITGSIVSSKINGNRCLIVCWNSFVSDLTLSMSKRNAIWKIFPAEGDALAA